MENTKHTTRLALVASDNPEIIEKVQFYLKDINYAVNTSSNLENCLESFKKQRKDFTFIDVSLFQQSIQKERFDIVDCKKALQPFWKAFPKATIIILGDQKNMRNVISLVRGGAQDYLTSPIDPIELKYICDNARATERLESELNMLRNAFWREEVRGIIESHNPMMQKVFDVIQQVAPTNMTTLILGETGTGKGVIAKLIHDHSKRSSKPFVHIHCGAIPDSLLESELFGHEKGAFTHAIQRKLGKFEIAEGGTIFLDEVGTMTHSAQVKLLQVLQDQIFQRVGGTVNIKTDVRVIAASNVDLKEMSENGNFRSDLYYRLNIFPIFLPALRERTEDIESLVKGFTKRFNNKYQKEINDLHPAVLRAFQEYPWPGNVRELENLVERAYILESTSTLTPESFPNEFFPSDTVETVIPILQDVSLADARNQVIDDFERQYLKELLLKHQGKINPAADQAGVSARQIHRMLAKHGIDKNEFKALKPSKKSLEILDQPTDDN